MKRIVFVVTAVVLVVIGARSADARSTLDKTSAPANTDVALTLNAPVDGLGVYNDRVVVTVPAGFTVAPCTAPADFTCTVASAANGTVVTFQGSATAQQLVTPTEQFPLRVRTAETPGKYAFPVDQFFSDGTQARWNADEGPNAAPTLTVTGTAPATTTTTPSASPPDSSTETTIPFDSGAFPVAPFDSPTTTIPPDLTPTTAAPSTDDTVAPDLAAGGLIGSDGGNSSGIRGGERVVLLALAGLTLGAATMSTLRARRA